MVFRNILLSAIVVGTLSGLLYGLYQHHQITPIIFAAEEYEVAEEVPITSHHNDSHEQPGWSPNDGTERITYTLLANIAVGIAYALFLISLMALHNLKANKPKLNAIRGTVWGIAALLIFFIGPTVFGLHPEVPGTEAAPLQNRQLWWLLCAIFTGSGIAVLYYSPSKFKLMGLALMLAPHIWGTPIPEQPSFANPDPAATEAMTQLTTQFIAITTFGMLMFFVFLGAMSGYAVRRFIRLEAQQQSSAEAAV